jgi:WD40 repeat protein
MPKMSEWKETQLNLRLTDSSKPIYCISWSKDVHCDSSGRKFHYFASCGDTKVVIHEIEIDNPRGICREKQTYIDEDKDEEFLACVFGGRSTINTAKGPQLLITGGRGKVIKVIDTIQNRQIFLLRGHGSDIHDLKVSPQNEALLLSAAGK